MPTSLSKVFYQILKIVRGGVIVVLACVPVLQRVWQVYTRERVISRFA